MTPPRSECPASSKLYGLMGSQGISDGGVNDGAIWPLFSALHAERRTLNFGERDLLFSVRGRIRGVRGSVCYLCAEPWQERRVLMIPNCLQILIVIEGYLEAFSIERAEAEVDCLRLN